MIQGVKIQKLKKYSDPRGWLCEVHRNDKTKYRPAMAYISYTKYGQVRGPHEHVKQSDRFIFIGPGSFKLYLWDNRKKSKTYRKKMVVEGGEDNSASVLIPPGVVHGYKCLTKKGSYVLNLPDKLFMGKRKKQKVDEIRWENDPKSPFKIK